MKQLKCFSEDSFTFLGMYFDWYGVSPISTKLKITYDTVGSLCQEARNLTLSRKSICSVKPYKINCIYSALGFYQLYRNISLSRSYAVQVRDSRNLHQGLVSIDVCE